jgi:hypothetical protein
MALHQPRIAQAHPDLVRVLVILAVVTAFFAAIVVIGALFGVRDAAPTYPFLPDPAGLELAF